MGWDWGREVTTGDKVTKLQLFIKILKKIEMNFTKNKLY